MRRAWRRLTLDRRVHLSLRDGQAIAGVLVDQVGDIVVLKGARLHTPGGPDDGVPLIGDTLIETANIDFAQLLPPADPARPNP